MWQTFCFECCTKFHVGNLSAPLMTRKSLWALFPTFVVEPFWLSFSLSVVVSSFNHSRSKHPLCKASGVVLTLKGTLGVFLDPRGMKSSFFSKRFVWQSPRGNRVVTHWASMLRWMWYSPSQVPTAKHVSYPQLTATLCMYLSANYFAKLSTNSFHEMNAIQNSPWLKYLESSTSYLRNFWLPL